MSEAELLLRRRLREFSYLFEDEVPLFSIVVSLDIWENLLGEVYRRRFTPEISTPPKITFEGHPIDPDPRLGTSTTQIVIDLKD